MTVSMRQSTVLCWRHGHMLFEITNNGVREHPCCQECEPKRYFEILKNATDIKLLTDDEIRDRARQ